MAGWIGVDLDGTLAHYDEFSELSVIGEPIPLMVQRVKWWRERGWRVKIFTARASVPELVPIVEEWLACQGLENLEITNVKDFEMIELWDALRASPQQYGCSVKYSRLLHYCHGSSFVGGSCDGKR